MNEPRRITIVDFDGCPQDILNTDEQQIKNRLLDQAANLGPFAIALVQSLWTDGVLCAASQAGHLFRLVGLYDPQRLEAACRRALFYKKTDYLTIERILSDNLENLPLSPYADVDGQLSLWPLNLPF